MKEKNGRALGNCTREEVELFEIFEPVGISAIFKILEIYGPAGLGVRPMLPVASVGTSKIFQISRTSRRLDKNGRALWNGR